MMATPYEQDVLVALRKAEDGLTLREVSAEIDAPIMETKNAIHRLYLEDQIRKIHPKRLDRNQRWALPEEGK